MLATEKILEGGIGGGSRGGAYLHWLCRLPGRPLLEMPIPQVGLLCPRRATRCPTALSWNEVLEFAAARRPRAAKTSQNVPKRNPRSPLSHLSSL